tara:strand:- start:4280 stop:4801 length:522 start_codon:yes stop_codon:yes gene_type:complete
LGAVHYIQYKKYTPYYEIEQQELDNIDGPTMHRNANPLVISFIEPISLKANVEKYHIYSMLTLFKQTKKVILGDNYYTSAAELLLIRVDTTTNITLINPKYKKYLKYNTPTSDFKEYILPEETSANVSTIDITMREYNILYIPRFWFFNVQTHDEINMYSADSLFSSIFRLWN